jgi:hypothetical protein
MQQFWILKAHRLRRFFRHLMFNFLRLMVVSGSPSISSSVGLELSSVSSEPVSPIECIDDQTYMICVSDQPENKIYLVMKRVNALNWMHWRRYADKVKLSWLDKVLAQGLLTETWVVYLIKGDPQFDKEMKNETKKSVQQAGDPTRLIEVGVLVNFPKNMLAITFFHNNENGENMCNSAISILQQQQIALRHHSSIQKSTAGDSLDKSDAMFFKCCAVVDKLRLQNDEYHEENYRCLISRTDQSPASSSSNSSTAGRLHNALLQARRVIH